MVTRAKATKKMREATRKIRAKDYKQMVTAASLVVVQNRGAGTQWRTGNPEYVLFRFPHWVKFASGFPKGHIVEKTVGTNVYKINAVKLLEWLYENGHSPYDTRGLLRNSRAYEELDKKLDRMFNLEGEV